MNNFKKIAADAAEKYTNLQEGGMPSSVIKHKQALAAKTPEDLHARFKEIAKRNGESVEDLARSTAWSHGYGKGEGKGSSHYWDKVKHLETKSEENNIEEMSGMQMKKREDTVKSMKKNFGDFRSRYGEKAKSVMYATATKQAMKEDEDQDTEDMHYCAKHVYSDLFGEGFVLEGQHAEPNEEGNIDWYMVEFDDGIRKIPTHKLEIMVAEYHMNHKKKKKMMEEEELDEANTYSSSRRAKTPAYSVDRQSRYNDDIRYLPKKKAENKPAEPKKKMMEDEELDEMSSKMKMKLGLYGKKKKMMEEDEVAEANDGNLANNAPPYDKVTHGDVITGRLGKDHQGGKSKHARERSKYQGKGVPMGPAEMLSKLKGMK